MERRQRGKEVVIDWVPGSKAENCLELIKQIGKELKVDINDSMINNCHRISGTIRNNERPRRIVANFMNNQEKVKMFNARQKIRNSSTKYIGIQPDNK